jgi:hypothetical protein
MVIKEFKCTKCGVLFQRTSEFFYKNKALKDGLGNVCKACCKIQNNKNKRKRYTIVKNINKHQIEVFEHIPKNIYKSGGSGSIRQQEACEKPTHINIKQYLYEKALKEKK